MAYNNLRQLVVNYLRQALPDVEIEAGRRSKKINRTGKRAKDNIVVTGRGGVVKSSEGAFKPQQSGRVDIFHYAQDFDALDALDLRVYEAMDTLNGVVLLSAEPSGNSYDVPGNEPASYRSYIVNYLDRT